MPQGSLSLSLLPLLGSSEGDAASIAKMDWTPSIATVDDNYVAYKPRLIFLAEMTASFK